MRQGNVLDRRQTSFATERGPITRQPCSGRVDCLTELHALGVVTDVVTCPLNGGKSYDSKVIQFVIATVDWLRVQSPRGIVGVREELPANALGLPIQQHTGSAVLGCVLNSGLSHRNGLRSHQISTLTINAPKDPWKYIIMRFLPSFADEDVITYPLQKFLGR